MRAFVVSCALFVTACGGHGEGEIDNVVGAACMTDSDCDTRCYIGGDFPGGFCSVPCTSDSDCPGDTYCMRDAGGVCMFACPAFDCTRLGQGWECRDEERQNGGHVTVCTGA